MMKSTVSLLPAALAMLGVASAAHAQSGMITINGEVTSVTCEISFNGVIGNDPNIRLPTVPASALQEGASAGRTALNVHVQGTDPVCNNGGITLQLDPRRAARLQNGRLVNQALTVRGTNAVVGLRDAEDKPIDLGIGWTSPPAPGTGDGTDILFYAEYYADGGDAIPGVFQAPLQYTLMYP